MLKRIIALMPLLFLLGSPWVCAQRVLTTPDFTSFSERDGAGLPSFEMLPIPGGGTLLRGNFEVWYDGIRFRDWLKLKANGEPDTSWRMEVSFGSSSTTSSSVQFVTTPHGLVLAGNIESINNVVATPFPGQASQSNPVGLMFVPWDATLPVRASAYPTDPSSALDASAVSLWALSDFDSSSGHVYVLTNKEMRRVSARTGDFDPSWRGVQKWGSYWPPLGPLRLWSDSAGGLWTTLLWISGSRFPQYHLVRWSASAAPLNENWQPDASFWPSFFGTFAGFAGGYIYGSTGRQGLINGVEEGLFLCCNKYALLVNDDYIYAVESAVVVSGAPIYSIARFPANSSNNVISNPWSFQLPPGYGAARQVLLWPTLGDPNNVAMMSSKPAVAPTESAPSGVKATTVLVVKEDLVGNEDLLVVEYYVPAIKHYFMTGRKNEQAILDGLPNVFSRTGMTFAAKSSRYSDIAEQPVCRLYAAPEKGGSNSHFYGTGNDCTVLNTITGLKYEGFDFSVVKPSTTGACPFTAVYPITRLFNNKAQTNDGNHRYVVSNAAKARMVAQGWVDEGAVFCSAGVTDATLN